MTPARVGINAVFLRPRMGGLETYVRRLVPELVRLRPDLRPTLFLSAEGRDYLAGEDWFGDVDAVTHRLLGVPGLTAVSELALLGELAGRRHVDLLHSVAMTGPLRVPCPHVVMIADVIWLHDPRGTGLATSTLWRTLVPAVARRADRVLTISEATRRDLVASFGLPAERIDVVPLGPGADEPVEPTPEPELRRALGLGDSRVVLSVSSKRPHKNLLRLIRALARVRELAPDVVLVLPGNPTRHEDELRAAAARLGLADAVRFPAYVDAADLEGLYALASIVAVPALLEGFGLPVLEAMRRGVPVACSNVSSLPEVAGDAARTFDPLDEGDIAAALLDLLQDGAEAARLAEAGRVRAATFTWRRTAEGTLECYERAVRERRR